ncbi:uncharacterized protein BO96DRAFT_471118 [Aspergillus niger CBS 101883]|uniref:Uncharacterized protein n=3 Tax=Aspergillus niger TaxID=5061 RepID=A2QE87_ASPNC|nr:uncharacterized protein BO96DRAFT_471118 [Aspergillus niger CBS 101883]XP_059600070.1 hypothetical protein An02g09800 [Aspergillus niger]PYH61715.1 hypothetical protein BO96DRAFT_471118 [Aspergillus niger CBS 101883]RDH23031.1 hypothetical protein M747DRAFT_231587 [Aspergillus niger ATCC 13496]CAK37848.1 hypothetical protein An02g09800 [Aspergillus niger]
MASGSRIWKTMHVTAWINFISTTYQRSHPISINAGNTSQLGPVCSILHYPQGSYVTLHSTVLSSAPAARVSLELSFTWTVNHPICGDMRGNVAQVFYKERISVRVLFDVSSCSLHPQAYDGGGFYANKEVGKNLIAKISTGQGYGWTVALIHNLRRMARHTRQRYVFQKVINVDPHHSRVRCSTGNPDQVDMKTLLGGTGYVVIEAAAEQAMDPGRCLMPSGSDSSGSAKPMASQWVFPARLPLISCKSLVTSPTATTTIISSFNPMEVNSGHRSHPSLTPSLDSWRNDL